jgi:hypothetical protein
MDTIERISDENLSKSDEVVLLGIFSIKCDSIDEEDENICWAYDGDDDVDEDVDDDIDDIDDKEDVEDDEYDEYEYDEDEYDEDEY